MNKTGTQTIETERLILRRFRIEDAQAMYDNWASDPAVTEYMTWPVHKNVDVTKGLISEWISKYEDGTYFNWVIEFKEDGLPVGNISVAELNEKVGSANIGYCMSKAYWGRGIMPEALKAVMDYLFDVVLMDRVAAFHDARNAKSGRVMEKAGMLTEGTHRASGLNNKGVCDNVWHAMIRSDRQLNGELNISLEDHEWPFTGKTHDRNIARAIVYDDDGYFYFVRVNRDDDFGKATFIETAGGGVEAGEDLNEAIRRELAEELGAQVDVIAKIGLVSDYYNLIGRHNLNNYFLCKITSWGERNLTQQEIEDFHLSTLKLTYEEAMAEYEKNRDTRLGRLVSCREMPVLRRAAELIGL